MTVTKLSVKKAQHGAAPLRNLNILDDMVVKVRDRELHLPGIITFTGPSGWGKSTAAAYIASKHQAYYVEVRSTWTRKAFLGALLHQMGLHPKQTVYEMMDQASRELADSQRPVIADEFDNAIDRNLVELVRDLYEQSRTPIIVIGEELLPQKLQKWERFHGRVMDWAQAEPANAEDAQALNRHYTPDITVKKDLLDRLVSEARGSVRRIVTNLDRIAQFARAEGLKDIGLPEWGSRKLHTAQPPQPRGGVK